MPIHPRLQFGSALLLICDLQEKFRPLIHRFPFVLNRSKLILQTSNILQIPKLVSEQYPEALGNTVTELSSLLPSGDTNLVVSKKQFSMIPGTAIVPNPVLEFVDNYSTRKQVILCGIEAHVCITQTALDFLFYDFEVFLLCDAISSQSSYDRAIALQRLQSAGAVLTTTESAIFEMIQTAEFDKFKVISKLLKESNIDNSNNEKFDNIKW